MQARLKIHAGRVGYSARRRRQGWGGTLRLGRPLHDRPPVGADGDEFEVITGDGRGPVVDIQHGLAVRLPDHAIPRPALQPETEIAREARPQQLSRQGNSAHAWYLTGWGGVLADSRFNTVLSAQLEYWIFVLPLIVPLALFWL